MAPDKREPLEKAELIARKLGHTIGSNMPTGWGFVLILASFAGTKPGADDRDFMTYISNSKREGIITMLREMADKLERQEPHV